MTLREAVLEANRTENGALARSVMDQLRGKGLNSYLKQREFFKRCDPVNIDDARFEELCMMADNAT